MTSHDLVKHCFYQYQVPVEAGYFLVVLVLSLVTLLVSSLSPAAAGLRAPSGGPSTVIMNKHDRLDVFCELLYTRFIHRGSWAVERQSRTGPKRKDQK